ncbi:LacI family DNA-binding transcriptional regulator [Nakamurella flavida]|uniref:LacI family DNA-binding transcriptional regulator n=1 Tax=Nakamurella flavida TaxID=363630 RepID=A0A938YR96_9ACTN|nr:LacI family DNA-binding transcriptional regulator [Nakamurella flavida]MBM9477987.1 LacI family DNA-binding transcriptional regulator [Nakamurella flavida]MDP9778297.1 DNA-binding LacI/PurR family transcriptional regulator [Nakamurella flavida]
MERHGSRPPATLASLAAELGVSRTTVSNAYNRPDQLSPRLRARVMEAARRLGYPGPDPVARSLRTRTAGAIGLLLAEQVSYAFRDPAAVAFLEGLALECDSARVGLLLVPATPGSDDIAAVSGAAVDGFVAYSMPDDDPYLTAALGRPVPAVICDQPFVPGVDLVGIDDRAASRQMADHLVRLGHRRVGVVCMRLGRVNRDGPVDLVRQENARYHVQRHRLAGLRQAFEAAGVAWDRIPVVERFDHTEDSGASAAAEVLALDPGITAVIATSDVLAVGVIRELVRRQQRVPQDVSVIGFDGIASAVEAGLTTMEQPVTDKGRHAGRLMMDPARSAQGRRITLPTTFVPGRTTAAPRH